MKITHGMARTREYKTWTSMKIRCNRIGSQSYESYGGRGIKVCDYWMESFGNFYESMGPRPSGMTIERVDVNGGYSPDNCVWASWKEQANNRRNTVLLTIDGVSKTISSWADESPVNYSTISGRLRKGWSHTDAVFTENIEKSSPKNCGDKNAAAKINKGVADSIRTRYASGESQSEIAESVGIDKSQVSRIVNMRAWT